ncbi:mip family channel protein [Stylonychia lemnae]|uniref:Mip family channel protein n=1 Tax=Stylonychia lemnae TaxID=5949 RepID=A0A078BCY4_STYLE|nr:mip family channel protein [Stylonychia lemnae]|eukprot:CDW91077.1 mip family channel protein [Stylonychia lemnae]
METGNFSIEKTSGYWLVFLYEIIGTALLFIGINFSQGNNNIVLAGIYAACMVTCRQTGAHFNMGLSLAVYIVEDKFKEQWICLIVYTIAELIGGFMGMWISYLFLGNKIAFIKPDNLNYSGFYVYFMETFFTFIMMLNILFGKHARLSLFSDTVPGVFGSLFGINFCMGCIGPYTGSVLAALYVKYVALKVQMHAETQKYQFRSQVSRIFDKNFLIGIGSIVSSDPFFV